MLYRMVYDSGPPAAWWYSEPMTWEALTAEITWRTRVGLKLPGHVVDAALDCPDQDPFAIVRAWVF